MLLHTLVSFHRSESSILKYDQGRSEPYRRRFRIVCCTFWPSFRKVLILGVGVGSLNACVAGLVPLHLPHLFTNSLEVTAAMRSLTPLLSWSLLTHACVMGLEGILLARRRLRFLAG